VEPEKKVIRMSEKKLLTKLKGFSRTLVVHSNTNPYAAVAAMGQMAGRSQEAGRYFRPSETFVPLIDGLEAEQLNAGQQPDQLAVEFKDDWVSYLRRTGLPTCGVTYDDARTPEANTMRFLNAHNRRIPLQKPRIVYESRELLVPIEYRQDYEQIVALIRNGGDLKPYLSRDIIKKGCPDKNDGLLNSWGIQHLHFRPEGTDNLLFCLISDTGVFVIQVLPHDAEHLWVDTQLIQVIHDNWADQIARYRQSLLSPEDIPADKRSSLRASNANFLITLADGAVYLPPGGGTMGSGDSPDDRMNCDKIFAELLDWQSRIGQNAMTIRAALDFTATRKLSVRMAFDNRICCFYEPTIGARLGGFVLAD
jgi:hypothetical protein